MPRHASSSRAALTAPSIDLLPASLVHFHSDSSSSRAAVSRRRQILKHISQIETARPEPTAHLSVATDINSNSSSTNASIATNLGELGARVGSGLPVVRAGATFITTLHASLALSASLYPPSNPASAPPSPCLFPQSPYSTFTAASVRRRLSVSMASQASDPPAPGPAPLPELDFVRPTKDEERVEAVKLVADSIAQRRQLASFALMTHPYFIGLMGIIFALVYQWLYKGRSSWAIIFTTCMGVLMAGFVGVRGAVGGYLALAESINWKWLDNDEIVVARWGIGDERKIIGSVVYRVEKASGSGNGRKGKKIASIRAWTTRQRERGNGVGKGLIEETVKQAKAKGVEDVRWDDGNIYEKRILPKWANSGFEEGLKESRKKLEGYIQEFLAKK